MPLLVNSEWRAIPYALSDRFHEMSVDERIVGRIANHSHWILSLLDLFYFAKHYLPQQDNAAIRSGQSLGCAIGDRPLSFPRHMILCLNHIHPKPGERMDLVRWIFVRLDVFDRRVVVLDNLAVFTGEEPNEINFRVRIIDRHANLSNVSLA